MALEATQHYRPAQPPSIPAAPFRQYSMVEPLVQIFRVITANFSGVRNFRVFTVQSDILVIQFNTQERMINTEIPWEKLSTDV